MYCNLYLYKHKCFEYSINIGRPGFTCYVVTEVKLRREENGEEASTSFGGNRNNNTITKDGIKFINEDIIIYHSPGA